MTWVYIYIHLSTSTYSVIFAAILDQDIIFVRKLKLKAARFPRGHFS